MAEKDTGEITVATTIQDPDTIVGTVLGLTRNFSVSTLKTFFTNTITSFAKTITANIIGSLTGNVTGNISGTTAEFTGNVEAGTFEGDGALLRNVPSTGIGGSSSTGTLSLQANSGNATPASKVTASKYNTLLFDVDENEFELKTGIEYTHEDDAIPFNKDINNQGKELIRNQTILNQRAFQGYNFNADTSQITVADNSKYAEIFANGGAFLIGYNAFSTGEGSGGRLIHKSSHQINFESGKFRFFITFSGANGSWLSASVITLKKDDIVVVSYNGSSTANVPTMHIGGHPVAMVESTAPTGTISSDAGTLDIGYISGSNFTWGGNIYKSILFNRELTDSEAKSFSGNPQMAIDYADEGASNVDLTGGTLAIGKNYRTTDFIAGDDFTNVASTGSDANVDGAKWLCIATTPTTWTNSSVLHRIGATLELKPQDATEPKWFDSSGNDDHGSVSNAPLTNKSQVQIAGELEALGTFTPTQKVKAWIGGVECYIEVDPV